MKRVRGLILPLLFLVPAASAIALPNYIDTYEADPMAKIKKGGCTLCHESNLGGQRNQFGDAFGDNLHEITPLMRAQFPDYFSYPIRKVSDKLILHFSDPENKVVVVEADGKKVEVDVAGKTVDGKKAVVPKD